MAFTLPTFNIDVHIWNPPTVPPAAPSLTVRGNLAWGKRVFPGLVGTSSYQEHGMTLLLPAGTDVQTAVQNNLNAYSVVEAPAGSGRFYIVVFVDDLGKGFDNEHRGAVLIQTRNYGDWPRPMP